MWYGSPEERAIHSAYSYSVGTKIPFCQYVVLIFLYVSVKHRGQLMWRPRGKTFKSENQQVQP